MKSSPEQPFLFRFEGKIPALKNSRAILPDWENHKIQVKPSAEVIKWYQMQKPLLLSELSTQSHLARLNRPFCVLEMYAPDAQTSHDGDNVYTTVQEALQKPTPPEKKRKEQGILNLVDDDKYVIHHCVFTYDLCADMPHLGAFLWIWENDLKLHPVVQVYNWYALRGLNLKDRYKTLTTPRLLLDE